MTTVRSVRLLASAALAGVFLLAGCGGSDQGPSSDTSSTGSGAASADLPTASGEFGEAPTLTFPDGDAPTDLQVEVLSEGDGAVVDPGAAVAASYLGQVWGSDTPFDESYSRGKPSLFSLSSVVAGWTQGIPDHTVGSRLLISIPPDLGYGEDGNAQAGIGGEDTIVFVVDIVTAYNVGDTGQADAQVVTDPAQLPVTIEGAVGAPATFTVNAGAAAPAEAQLIRIADGTGETTAAGQQVAVAFVATYWDNTGTESSWTPSEGSVGGPLVSNLGGGTVFDLAIGVPVGSRVLLTALASADSPALVVLVDILGVV